MTACPPSGFVGGPGAAVLADATGAVAVAAGASFELEAVPLLRLDRRDYVLVVHVGEETGLVGEAIGDAAEAGFLFRRAVRVSQDKGAFTRRLVVVPGGVLQADAAEATTARIAQSESGCDTGFAIAVAVRFRDSMCDSIGGLRLEARRCGFGGVVVVVDALAVGLALLAGAKADDGLAGWRGLHWVRSGVVSVSRLCERVSWR